jgi:transposase InsO family protein
MLDTRHDLSLCGVAGTKLVSDHHAWGDTLVLEQLAHQTQGGCLVPSALQQGIEHIAISIDRAYAKGVTLDFSRPDKLTDNEFIEAFNGSFRAECPRP